MFMDILKFSFYFEHKNILDNKKNANNNKCNDDVLFLSFHNFAQVSIESEKLYF